MQRTTQTTPKPTCTHNNEPSLYNLSLCRQMATAPANDESFTCGVCLDIFVDPCTMTPCGHSACKRCLCLWLDHQHGTALCPICTGVISHAALSYSLKAATEHSHGNRVAARRGELGIANERPTHFHRAFAEQSMWPALLCGELPLLALGGIVLSLAIGASVRLGLWVICSTTGLRRDDDEQAVVAAVAAINAVNTTAALMSSAASDVDADAAVVEPMVTDKTAEAAATHPREHGNLAAGVTILTPMAIFVWVIISILLTTMCTLYNMGFAAHAEEPGPQRAHQLAPPPPAQHAMADNNATNREADDGTHDRADDQRAAAELAAIAAAEPAVAGALDWHGDRWHGAIAGEADLLNWPEDTARQMVLAIFVAIHAERWLPPPFALHVVRAVWRMSRWWHQRQWVPRQLQLLMIAWFVLFGIFFVVIRSSLEASLSDAQSDAERSQVLLEFASLPCELVVRIFVTTFVVVFVFHLSFTVFLPRMRELAGMDAPRGR